MLRALAAAMAAVVLALPLGAAPVAAYEYPIRMPDWPDHGRWSVDGAGSSVSLTRDQETPRTVRVVLKNETAIIDDMTQVHTVALSKVLDAFRLNGSLALAFYVGGGGEQGLGAACAIEGSCWGDGNSYLWGFLPPGGKFALDIHEDEPRGEIVITAGVTQETAIYEAILIIVTTFLGLAGFPGEATGTVASYIFWHYPEVRAAAVKQDWGGVINMVNDLLPDLVLPHYLPGPDDVQRIKARQLLWSLLEQTGAYFVTVLLNAVTNADVTTFGVRHTHSDGTEPEPTPSGLPLAHPGADASAHADTCPLPRVRGGDVDRRPGPRHGRQPRARARTG